MEFLRIEKEASGFTRIVWRKSDGGIHMQGVAPGESLDMHLDAVNADMQRRGLVSMTDEQKTVIRNAVNIKR